MAESKKSKLNDPGQIDAKENAPKKNPVEGEVEPIKPGDQRVTRKKSLLDTCYTTSSGKK